VRNTWVVGKGTAHLRRISGWVGSFEGPEERNFKINTQKEKNIFFSSSLIYFSFFLIMRK